MSIPVPACGSSLSLEHPTKPAGAAAQQPDGGGEDMGTTRGTWTRRGNLLDITHTRRSA
ncbi:hypothetical protein [Streptomyces niveus]|uniref:hypothetical protein n=1 Tax=Streptomyces niveus TaxID=193462 RepID=UPI0036D2C940